MLESAIQSAIVKKLKANKWLVNTYIKPPGWPDITAFNRLTVLFIEVKRPGKKITELQKITIERFKKYGFTVEIMTSAKDVNKWITS